MPTFVAHVPMHADKWLPNFTHKYELWFTIPKLVLNFSYLPQDPSFFIENPRLMEVAQHRLLTKIEDNGWNTEENEPIEDISP